MLTISGTVSLLMVELIAAKAALSGAKTVTSDKAWMTGLTLVDTIALSNCVSPWTAAVVEMLSGSNRTVSMI